MAVCAQLRVPDDEISLSCNQAYIEMMRFTSLPYIRWKLLTDIMMRHLIFCNLRETGKDDNFGVEFIVGMYKN